MTENKPIIVDGVDVSTCSERGETISGITCGNGTKIRLADRYIYKYKLCKDNPNCLFKQLSHKTQECEKLKKYLNQIRDEELSHLDIEWDEYETSARQEDYSNIITLVERALGEIND